MSTDNRADLRDYYALAVGAGIGYHTPRIARHVELGMSGFFMFNLHSSDLAAADPRTGRSSRYEAGLFNALKPNDHEDLDRLEELYMRYHFGHSSRLTLGRQIPTSPFVNPQDGRMRPTLTEGVVLEWQEGKSLHVTAEYLVRLSPRSTVDWFSIGESVGLLPGGVTTTGQPSRYAGNIQSDGLLILGLTQQRGRLHWQLWETYFPSVFHTAYGKIEWTLPVNKGRQWLFGGQLTRQWALGHGGNENVQLTYMEPGTRSLVVSGQAGYQTPRWTWLFNATRITAEGRYLMPRTWGREPFYTYMSRERNEGLGNVNAVTGSVQYSNKPHWQWELTAGYYQLPNVSNYRLNKYGLPSYSQLNLRASYRFTGLLDGLEADILLVRKDNVSGASVADQIAQDRVGMSQINSVLNYHF